MKKKPPPIFFKKAKNTSQTSDTGAGTSDQYNIYINRNTKHNPMDATTIAGKVFSLLSPYLKKNKSLSQISSEIREATETSILEIWEKVKPLFIEEFAEDSDQLSEDIESADVVRRELRKKIQSNDELKAYLDEKLKDAETKDGIIQIGRGNVSISGNVTGNSGDVKISGGGNDKNT